MVKKISEKDLVKVANLAQITLTEKEVLDFSKDLESILSYFDKLQEINTENADEIGHITGMTNVYREDESVDISSEEKEMILSNVPNKAGRHIRVKNVL